MKLSPWWVLPSPWWVKVLLKRPTIVVSPHSTKFQAKQTNQSSQIKLNQINQSKPNQTKPNQLIKPNQSIKPNQTNQTN